MKPSYSSAGETSLGRSESILQDGGIRLEVLSRLASRPKLFEPSPANLWTDPYISSQMLEAHMDATTDAASRRPETIDAEVAWLVPRLGLHPGDRVLDCGCGPELFGRDLGSLNA